MRRIKVAQVMTERIAPVVVLAFGLLVPSTLLAQDAQETAAPAKAAWQWTDEERVASRLDVVDMQRRAALHAAHLTGSGAGGTRAPLFVIDGKENPELFLPFELFTALVAGVDPSLSVEQRSIRRALYESSMKRLGYDPAEVWIDLHAATVSYFAVRDAVQHPGASAQSSRPMTDAPQVRLCTARYDAINAARDRIGREAFDRLLYTVVAPTLSTSGPLPAAKEGAGLLYLAAGCR